MFTNENSIINSYSRNFIGHIPQQIANVLLYLSHKKNVRPVSKSRYAKLYGYLPSQTPLTKPASFGADYW
ncbi:unnamed protein product [Haemonchus placei]|uniref:Uncharacterized protein n=1 Tax=Haemonchus placei TaxID=6290 RepID=A0A3P7V8Y9_HAEPC|nr:unnamed protein product [Haemonchus placei]